MKRMRMRRSRVYVTGFPISKLYFLTTYAALQDPMPAAFRVNRERILGKSTEASTQYVLDRRFFRACHFGTSSPIPKLQKIFVS